MTDEQLPGQLDLFPEPERVPLPLDEEDLRVGTGTSRAGERARRRILAGVHPLTLRGMNTIRLHPDAPADPFDRAAPGLRCGHCAYREPGEWPSCTIGRREVPNRATDELARRLYPTVTEPGPRESRSEATDCRAWWPACYDYQPRPAPERGA